MVNSDAPKGYVIPAPLILVLSLFLRCLDYALEFVQQCAFLLCIFICLATIAIWNFDDYCKNFHLSPYKPITNTTWVRTRLCKLQKRCARLAATSDKAYQLLAHGRRFSPGTPASSTTKTGRHEIYEILLKVAFNTIKQVKSIYLKERYTSVCSIIAFPSNLILSHVSILWKTEDQLWKKV